MAAFTAASAALKAEDNNVTVVSDEAFSPYYRIRILETLSSEPAVMADVSGLPEDRYEQLDSVSAVSIDRSAHLVTLSDERVLHYDRLVIATGSSANTLRIEGSDASGILTLRTLADVEVLKSELDAGQGAAVIGGGLLGLEAAAVIARYTGHTVSVIEGAEYLLPRQLDRDSSRYLQKRLEAMKLSFVTGAKVSSFAVKNGQVSGIVLSDGRTVPCQVVVESIGVTPRAGLAAEAGLKVNRGIIINERCQTSDEDIYAIGDVAEFEGKVPGMMAVALDTGSVCGSILAGKDAAYKPAAPSVMLKVAALDVISFGSIQSEGAEVYVNENDSFRESVFVKDGIVTGACAVGTRAHFALFRSNIGRAFNDDFRLKAGL